VRDRKKKDLRGKKERQREHSPSSGDQSQKENKSRCQSAPACQVEQPITHGEDTPPSSFQRVAAKKKRPSSSPLSHFHDRPEESKRKNKRKEVVGPFVDVRTEERTWCPACAPRWPGKGLKEKKAGCFTLPAGREEKDGGPRFSLELARRGR